MRGLSLRKSKLALALLPVLLLAVVSLWAAGRVGVPVSRIESDARESQRIPAVYETAQAHSDATAALLFYGAAQKNSIFSVYVNRPGLSFGYFFHAGGSLAEIEDGIVMLTADGCDSALLSLNRPRVSRIEWSSAGERQTIAVDPNQPFAAVLPQGYGAVTLYDGQSAVVPFQTQPL